MSLAHAEQLQAGVLQALVQPLGLPSPFLELGLAVAGELAQFPDRRRWDERGPDQPVLDQLRDPHRIGDVGLASRNVAHVHGVEQLALHRVLERVEHRPPEHPGGLHSDHRHLVRDQPIAQGQQLDGERAERADLADPPALWPGRAHARHHGVLVHIQPGAAGHHHIHRIHHLLVVVSLRPAGGASPGEVWGTCSEQQSRVLETPASYSDTGSQHQAGPTSPAGPYHFSRPRGGLSSRTRRNTSI
jgi:hypothetical protein